MSTFVLYMFLRICQAYFQIKYWMVRWYMAPVYSRYFLYPKLAEIDLFIYLQRGSELWMLLLSFPQKQLLLA